MERRMVSRNKKIFYTMVVIISIAMNLIGRIVAFRLSFPIWLDCIGTISAAYITGPIGGIIAGIVSTVFFGYMYDNTSIYYLLASVVIAILAGYTGKKRKCYKNLYANLTAGIMMSIVATGISVPINILTNDAMTGNFWGDTVIEYAIDSGIPSVIAWITGQFYLDFVDKILAVTLIYLLYALVHVARKGTRLLTAQIGIFFFIFSVCTGNAYADSEEADIYSFVQTIYNSENGLPCGSANDIKQTEDGVIWIGTYAGLYRFNGSDFKLMDDYESIKNSNCLFVDSKGRLWVGTNDNGFSVLNNGEIETRFSTADGLPADSVRSIIEDEHGHFIIGTAEQTVVISYGNEIEILKIFDEIKYASNSSVNGDFVSLVTSAGQLYIIKGDEITDMISDEDDRFRSCDFRNDGKLITGINNEYIRVYSVENGKLNMDKEIECSVLNSENEKVSLSGINGIYHNNKETYICADNGIGFLSENDEFLIINSGEFDNSVSRMCVDYQGNIWFTSTRLGLLKLCKSNFSDLYTIVGLKSVVVNSTAFYDGNLYVGTDTGLDIINLEKKTIVDSDLREKLTGVRIRSLKVDSKERLWICTYGEGLWCYNGTDTKVFSTENDLLCNNIRMVLELDDGKLAVAQNDGVDIFDGDNKLYSFTADTGLGTGLTLCLLENSKGQLLAGTDGSGIAVIEGGEIVRKITRQDGLSSGVILRMVEDKKGSGIFIVTSNSLCYMYDDFNVITLDKFPYFNNYDVKMLDNGKLFVSGSSGIYVIDRDGLMSGEYLAYTLLDSSDGLTGSLTANAWNYVDEEGIIYLSTNRGVYSMNMNRYGYTCTDYKANIISVEVDDEAVKLIGNTGIMLNNNAKRIKLVPEVLNYSIDIPYVSYYLEGFEEVDTTVPFNQLSEIVYTNLKSGKYVFHLNVLGNDGNILTECRFPIEKELKAYENSWFRVYFYSVLSLMLVLTTWILVRYRIEKVIEKQQKELRRAHKEIEMGNQTILAIAKTVDAKDSYTSHHSQRVADYSMIIAKQMGFGEAECENMRKAALLHDIGKIGIPDSVLNKNGRLNDEEYEMMKAHVVRGGEILKDFTLVDHVADGAMYHHEKYDGTGYMKGLKGDEIPLYARIIAIADTFDAMTSDRVYRKKLPKYKVLEELKRCRGTQFDPEILDIFLKLIEEGKVEF